MNHWEVLICINEFVCLRNKIKIEANKGAKRKRKKVAILKETFFRTILEKEVEVPHIIPAERARRAAIRVPFPDPIFTFKSLKVTKYEAIIASSAQIRNFLDIFSLSKMAAVVIAQMG